MMAKQMDLKAERALSQSEELGATEQHAEPPKSATARRLSDFERAEILRLHAEGKKLAQIASAVKTSIGTVQNVLKKRGAVGRAPKAWVAKPAEPAAAPEASEGVTEFQDRIIQVGISYILDGTADPTEVEALKPVLKEKLEQRIREARKTLYR